MTSLLTLLFSIKVAFCSCRPEIRRSGFQKARSEYRVERLGRLPRPITESSGLVYRPGQKPAEMGKLLTINDSGGQPTLYEVRMDGTLTDSLRLPNAVNTDWEALAAKDSSVLFVGDIGNNFNSRRSLTIYRIDRRTPGQTGAITFHYADQSAFPPPKDTRNFDSEALIYAGDSLFVITKNRSRRPIRLYGLPAHSGHYTLMPLDSLFLKSMVTDAAISPGGNRLAVLTYGKIFLFDLADGRVSLRQPRQCIRLPRGQTEGISFVNENDLVLTNERGNVFMVRRRKY